MEEFLNNLNQPQKEAVLATEGPVLVLAGAGSGKTKALTHRIAHLVREKHISPYNILAVTFTNKAAKEMQQRVASLLQYHVSGSKYHADSDSSDYNTGYMLQDTDGLIRLPWLGTFHSICVRILRREADFIGYGRSFTIYDASDQLSIIKRIMRELNIDTKNYNPNSISYFISGAKNELMDVSDYKKYINSPFEQVTSKVYERYEKYLKAANGMDFDDLIMQCVRLFENNPAVLERYQELFRYILIDEYQDTNEAQYVWTKLLAEKHKNIMVVGDDSQSIYSWRGANFRNILNFEKDYKGALVIKLEQNYRSTKTILDAANDVIKFNKNKTNKVLWTENGEGKPITVYQALNEKDEAEFIATELTTLVRRNQISSIKNQENGKSIKSTTSALSSQFSYSDCAVLYRTNAQSRAVEEVFLRFKIPYRVVGGVRFYERKEIKDIIAYLRFIVNPTDFEALKRVVAAPPRGIGEKTLDKVSSIKYQVSSITDQIPKKLADFLEMIEEIRLLKDTLSLPELINLVVIKSGYKNFLLDGSPEGEGRWENVQELMTVAQSLEENQKSNINCQEEGTEPTYILDQFLEQVALVQDVDEIKDEHNVVTLMTMHAAKGLEFKAVFIVGVEEGLFPHSRALMDQSEMEEERRLCYVGITRAKERMYLLYAFERNIYGRFQSNPKSRFIENIGEHLLDQL